MSDTILKKCYFCEEWFPGEKVKEVALATHPTSGHNEVFVCEECLKKSKIERLTSEAVKVLSSAGVNEIEVSKGDLKIHLVRFTPAPCYQYPQVWHY